MLCSEVTAFQRIVSQLIPNGLCTVKNIPFTALSTILLDLLKERALMGQSVIFILDNFDFFVSHTKQLLLYNLLDWMTSKSVRMSLIGVTCCFTMLQKLEKRVQSRFSNRQIVVTRPSFEAMVSIVKDACKIHGKFVLTLEENVSEVFLKWYDVGKSIRWFLAVLSTAFVIVSQEIEASNHDRIRPNILKSNYLKKAIEWIEPNIPPQLFTLFTVRELTLVIAMLRWEAMEHAFYTFEMVFEQYVTFARTTNTSIIWTRRDAMKTFEHLLAMNCITMVGNPFRIAGGKAAKLELPLAYRPVRITFEPKTLLDALKNESLSCPTALRQWALRTVVA